MTDVIASIEQCSGAEKASIMMLALSEAEVARLFGLLDHQEVMEISQTMAVLGRVEAGVVEALLLEFGERLVRNGGVAGGFDATEKLLLRALDPGRAESIMQEIRGPVGRTVWDKLAHVNETVLASYLKNEYPQITECRLINDINQVTGKTVVKIRPCRMPIGNKRDKAFSMGYKGSRQVRATWTRQGRALEPRHDQRRIR